MNKIKISYEIAVSVEEEIDVIDEIYEMICKDDSNGFIMLAELTEDRVNETQNYVRDSFQLKDPNSENWWTY